MIRESISNGTITEEDGEAALQRVADWQADCDGTGRQDHASVHRNYSHSTHRYNYELNHDCPYNHSQNNCNCGQGHRHRNQ